MKLALAAGLAFLSIASAATAQDITGRASVVDGDTIEVQGTRIRFDGLDAPESKQRCTDKAGKQYRCGRVSADALDTFLAKSRPVTCHKTGTSYDRWVAVCSRADGASVNEWMVANGYAVDWPKYSKGKYAPQQNKARAAKLGVWSGSFEMPCKVRRARCE